MDMHASLRSPFLKPCAVHSMHRGEKAQDEIREDIILEQVMNASRFNALELHFGVFGRLLPQSRRRLPSMEESGLTITIRNYTLWVRLRVPNSQFYRKMKVARSSTLQLPSKDGVRFNMGPEMLHRFQQIRMTTCSSQTTIQLLIADAPL